MNEIKTFEDACKALKLDPEKVIPDFSMFPEKHQKAMIAHAKLSYYRPGIKWRLETRLEKLGTMEIHSMVRYGK